MATSGTTSYNPLARVCADDALRILGVLEEGQTASSTQLSDISNTYEKMLKGLQATKALQLWKVTTQSITLVASTASYTLGPSDQPLQVTDVVFRDSNNIDTQMTRISRDEYWNLPNKTDTSNLPTQYYIDHQLGTSTIYFWPVPDATAATGTAQVVQIAPIEDVSDATLYELDMPAQYLEAVTYMLAIRLAPMYGMSVTERRQLIAEYREFVEPAWDFDVEKDSIYIVPSYKRK